MSDQAQTQNGCHNTPLFDPVILTKLDPTKFSAQYKNGVTPLNPGEFLHLRPLCLEDYDKGYLELLKQLTVVGDVTKDEFTDRFNKMKACDDTYYIVVIEDTSLGQVIGSATLVKEQKFIHHATSRARVEDVVVNDIYRGKQLGKILVDVLVCLSQELGCYKVSLECADVKVKFYSMFGFQRPSEQNYMQQKFFN